MTSIRFSDMAGELKTDPDSLRWFIELWFDAEDIVVIQKLTDKTKREFLALPAKDLLENAENILNRYSSDTHKLEYYYGVNPVQRIIGEWEPTRRQAGLGQIKGFFADLDVKSGAFESEGQILKYLEKLAIKPTTVVQSGSGGIHASWKVSGQIEPEDLKAWWVYLQHMAPEGVNIDRLVNVDRIFRLPGSVRWSKTGGHSSTVKLIDGCREESTIEQVRDLTGELFQDHRRKQKILKSQKTLMIDRAFKKADNNSGLVKLLCERRTNEMDWSEILEPHGWELYRTNHDGTRQWQRPGGKGKSATTDYTHHDGTISEVMSLLSGSPDTNLIDLKEVGIPLTKFQVLLRLQYTDDLNQLITDFRNKENS